MASHRYPSLLFIGMLFIAGVAMSTSVSAEACPVGSVAITPATRQAATQAGIPVSSQCWQPQDANTGQSVGEAKTYLRSILCPADSDNYGGSGPDATIQGLDSKFAVCAASFIKAAKGSGIPVCIREGARTVAKQNEYAARYKAGTGGIACTKGAACEHPHGIAIDVNTNSQSNYERLWALGPQFGVNFYLKSKDKVHFVPLKGGCSAGGTTPTDQQIPSTNYDFPQYAPTPSYSSPLQSLGAPAPTFPSAPVAATPTTVGTPTSPTSAPTAGICSPQFSCSNSVMYYQTTSCTTQVYQNCAHGCSGNSCAVAPSTGTSTTATTTQASSTEEILDTFANPVSITTAAIGTAAPIAVALNNDTSDIIGLSTTNSTGTIVNPGTITSIQPISAQQTFTTTDLSGNAYSGGTVEISGASKILSDLKAALTWALSFLTGRKAQ